MATVAFCGPNDRFATQVAVGIVPGKEWEADFLERWISEERDVRADPGIGEELMAFVRRHEARTVVVTGRVIGCPHEEGVDHPEGEACPRCPFWANRDRWSGGILQ